MKTETTHELDPVTLEVIKNRFRELGSTMEH